MSGNHLKQKTPTTRTLKGSIHCPGSNHEDVPLISTKLDDPQSHNFRRILSPSSPPLSSDSSTTANTPNNINSPSNPIIDQPHKYRLLPNCLSPRKNHALAVTEDQQTIYIFGGQSCNPKGDLLGCLHKYDAGRMTVFTGITAASGEMNWTEIRRPERETPGVWPSRRKGHTLVAIGPALLLFGGVSVLGGCSSPSMRSGLTNSTPAHTASATLHHLSGTQRNETVIYFNDVWRFDLERHIWSEIVVEGDKPTGRAHHTINAQGSQMIMYGGYGCHEDFDVWSFDTVDNVWSRIPSSTPLAERPPRRYGHVSTIYDDCLFVFGGQQKSQLCDPSVWSFTLTGAPMGAWTKIDVSKNSVTVASSRVFLAASRIGQKWFLHGGSNKSGVTNALHEFDLKMLKWRSLNSILPQIPALEMHTGATVKTAVNIVSLLVLGGMRPYAGPLDLTGKCESYKVDFIDICQTQWLTGRVEDAYIGWLVREGITKMDRCKNSRRYRAELSEMKSLRNTSERQNEGLQAENDQLRTEIEELKLKVKKREDLVSHVQKKLKELGDRHAQLTSLCSRQRTAPISQKEIIVICEEVVEVTRRVKEVFKWVEEKFIASHNSVGQLEEAEEDRLVYSEQDLNDLTDKYAKLQRLHKKLMTVRDQDVLELQESLRDSELREKTLSKSLDSRNLQWKEISEDILETIMKIRIEEESSWLEESSWSKARLTTDHGEGTTQQSHQRLFKKSLSAITEDKSTALLRPTRNTVDSHILDQGFKSEDNNIVKRIDVSDCLLGVKKLVKVVEQLKKNRKELVEQYTAARTTSQALERALQNSQQISRRSDQQVEKLIHSIDALNQVKELVAESRKSLKHSYNITADKQEIVNCEHID